MKQLRRVNGVVEEQLEIQQILKLVEDNQLMQLGPHVQNGSIKAS